MASAVRNLTSLPVPRLLSNGGPSSTLQLATRVTPHRHPAKAMFESDAVVAVYETHDQAEFAVRELQSAGVDMKSLSIAAKDPQLTEHVSGYYTAGDRMLSWGKIGAYCGAVWGLLFDTALFAIPGIGPVLLSGPLVSWIVAVLEGGIVFGSLSVLGAGLMSIGIPKDSVVEYERALQTSKFLLIVHGTSSEVSRAKHIIRGTKPSRYTVHGENVLVQ